jgi:septal ring factor EnvC (AmiA/AmiB activator)
MIKRTLRIVLVFAGIVLWLLPQEVQADDVETKSQLSYISKIVGGMESSMIKIKGDVRFVKRQIAKTVAEIDLSAKRQNTLEIKVDRIESLLDVVTEQVEKIGKSLEDIEKKMDGLFSGSCSNKRLCGRKK